MYMLRSGLHLSSHHLIVYNLDTCDRVVCKTCSAAENPQDLSYRRLLHGRVFHGELQAMQRKGTSNRGTFQLVLSLEGENRSQ